MVNSYGYCSSDLNLFHAQKKHVSARQKMCFKKITWKWLSYPIVRLQNITYYSHLLPLKVQIFSSNSDKFNPTGRFNKRAACPWRDPEFEILMSAIKSLFNRMHSMTDQKFQRITSTTALYFGFIFKKKRLLDATTLVTSVLSIWAMAWDFQQCGMCDQLRLRPACAYAQTDQSLY